MVMFGNYGVSQSYLPTATLQKLTIVESNSPISEECASKVLDNSVKTCTPARVYMEAQQSKEAELAPGLAATGITKRESGVASTFVHPLSSHEDAVTCDLDVDILVPSGSMRDVTGPDEEDVASMSCSTLGKSLLVTSPPMPLNSANSNPLSPSQFKGRNATDVASWSTRNAHTQNNPDSDDQTLLAQSQSSTDLPELSEEAEFAPDRQKLACGITKRESGAESVFTHPLSSLKISMTQDEDGDTLVTSGGLMDISRSSTTDGALVDSSSSGLPHPGPFMLMPLNSADLNLLTQSQVKRHDSIDAASSPDRKIKAHSNSDLDQEQSLPAHSRSSTVLTDTSNSNIQTHSKAESDQDKTAVTALTGNHPTTTNENSVSRLMSSGTCSYDFVIWYHDADEKAAKCIYDFLEESLHLQGFMYSRDKTLGTYTLNEMDKAIQSSDKVFLFITPQSKDCGKFEAQMHSSLKHSIESRRNNVIPIYWELDRKQGPSVVGHIFSLNYCGCSDRFKEQLAKIFPDHSQSSHTSQTTPSCNDKSGQSSNLRQSQSLPTPEKKKRFFRFLSLGK